MKEGQMRLVVGLGNPGSAYDGTRHNIGFRIVRSFAQWKGWSFRGASQVVGEVAQGMIGDQKVILLLPMTYMNSSGSAVRLCVDYFKIPLESMLVVSDDIALPFQTMRLRKQGSSGGHNGLLSIETHLGTRHYARLRIGVGDRAAGDLADYVLGKFTPQELQEMPEVVEKAMSVIELMITDSVEAAMQKANKLDK